ncbi:uncharacterized protein LOC107001144 [Solanum pennellii]|uniref:Uncharacterized protein LOC107001144 n=1 Tax=Solanum pennellii TaxID=28526 RepID=A0ABM1FCA4_SOLPN|nr:uncharacterized protein LOC107001144 [Solanum pennellii]
MSLYQLVYRKAYNLPVELVHKVIWEMKRLNWDWTGASEQSLNELNVLDEFFLEAYESSAIYKEKMKKYHDQSIEKREFASKWTGPFLNTKVFPHGAIELENKEGTRFTFNGQRIKIYLGHSESVHEVIEAYHIKSE